MILDLVNTYVIDLLATLRIDVKGQKGYVVYPVFKTLQIAGKAV